jgi:hypothetical protein
MTHRQFANQKALIHGTIIAFQVAISICARLAEGKSLRAICSDAGMPGRATVFRWIARHKEFRDEHTLACEPAPRKYGNRR